MKCNELNCSYKIRIRHLQSNREEKNIHSMKIPTKKNHLKFKEFFFITRGFEGPFCELDFATVVIFGIFFLDRKMLGRLFFRRYDSISDSFFWF